LYTRKLATASGQEKEGKEGRAVLGTIQYSVLKCIAKCDDSQEIDRQANVNLTDANCTHRRATDEQKYGMPCWRDRREGSEYRQMGHVVIKWASRQNQMDEQIAS